MDKTKLQESLREVLSLARYDWRKGIGSFGNAEGEMEETIERLLSNEDLMDKLVEFVGGMGA